MRAGMGVRRWWMLSMLAGLLLLPPIRELVLVGGVNQIRAALEGRPLKTFPSQQIRVMLVSIDQRELELEAVRLNPLRSAEQDQLELQLAQLRMQRAQARQELLWKGLRSDPIQFGGAGMLLVVGAFAGIHLYSRKRPPGPLKGGRWQHEDVYAEGDLDDELEPGSDRLSAQLPGAWRTEEPSSLQELARTGSPHNQAIFIAPVAYADLERAREELPRIDRDGLPISLELPDFDPERLAAALMAVDRPSWSAQLLRSRAPVPVEEISRCLEGWRPGEGLNELELLTFLAHQLALHEARSMRLQPRASAVQLFWEAGEAEPVPAGRLEGLRFPSLVGSLSATLALDGRPVRWVMPGIFGYQVQELSLDERGLMLRSLKE